jgi:hypothetical protein
MHDVRPDTADRLQRADSCTARDPPPAISSGWLVKIVSGGEGCERTGLLVSNDMGQVSEQLRTKYRLMRPGSYHLHSVENLLSTLVEGEIPQRYRIWRMTTSHGCRTLSIP